MNHFRHLFNFISWRLALLFVVVLAVPAMYGVDRAVEQASDINMTPLFELTRNAALLLNDTNTYLTTSQRATPPVEPGNQLLSRLFIVQALVNQTERHHFLSPGAKQSFEQMRGTLEALVQSPVAMSADETKVLLDRVQGVMAAIHIEVATATARQDQGLHTFAWLVELLSAGVLMIALVVLILMNKLHQSNIALAKLINDDTLTGVSSRHYLQVRIDTICDQARTQNTDLTYAVMDIDHFKQINDRYGHQVGDRVLQALGKTLLSVRAGNDIFARIGGEEFLGVFPGRTLDEAMERCREIQQGLPWQLGSDLPDVTISVGVATARGAEVETEGLYRNADAALYLAKLRGRNRIEAYRPETPIPIDRRKAS